MTTPVCFYTGRKKMFRRLRKEMPLLHIFFHRVETTDLLVPASKSHVKCRPVSVSPPPFHSHHVHLHLPLPSSPPDRHQLVSRPLHQLRSALPFLPNLPSVRVSEELQRSPDWFRPRCRSSKSWKNKEHEFTSFFCSQLLAFASSFSHFSSWTPCVIWISTKIILMWFFFF